MKGDDNINLNTILEKIPKLSKGQRFVLGIDGLSRSGKTTFTKKLIQVLRDKDVQVCVIHLDDFILERKRRYNTGHKEWFEYYSLQWDVEYLKSNLFEKIKVSNQLILPIYDGTSDVHHFHNVEIPDTCVFLIEGIFLQRPEWWEYFDFIAYLECPRDTRFSRESDSTKKNIEKFRNRYWKAEDYYIKNRVPTKGADVVFNNE
jgi:uridine kinase